MSEYPQSPNLAHLASFGSSNRAPSNLVGDKKENLKMTALQKQAMLGSPEEQQRVALAEIGGNQSGRNQSTDDILDPNVSDAQFVARYGEEALANRHRYGEVLYNQNRLKEAERTNGETAWDTAMGLAGVGTNLAGGAATLVGQAVDTVVTKPFNEITGVDVPYLAPNVADWTQGASEFFRGQKSELSQARAQIHAVEGALNQEDSDIITAQEADAAPADEGIMGLIQRKAKQYGREGAVAISNYADDPIAQGDLVVDAIGSILGIAGAGKIITAQRVGSKLMAKYLGQGLSKQAAKAAVKAELKTDAGKLMLAKAAERNIIPIIGATEGGSSVADTLNQIKGMTPEDFKGNDAYNALEDQGLTHEEITDELAHQAGNITAPIAVGVALGAGKLVSKFAANPFSTTARTTAAEFGANTAGKQIAKRGGEVGKNVAFETTEEAIQEGGAAFATNVGLKGSGVDPDLALDKGVAARAAEGALGGLAGAGALQAPGLAGGVAKDVAKGALDAASKGIDAAVKARDAQAIAGAANNPKARATAAEESKVTSTQLIAELANLRAESASKTKAADGGTSVNSDAVEASDKGIKLINDRIKEATYLTDSEAEYTLSASIPEVAETLQKNRELGLDGKPATISRISVFQAMGAVLEDANQKADIRNAAAIEVLRTGYKIQQANSTDVIDALGSLPEGNTLQELHSGLVSKNQVVLSSPFLKTAEDVVSKLTKEQFEAMPDVQMVMKGEANATIEASVAETIAFVKGINKAAVSNVLVEKALEQVNNQIKKTGGKATPKWKSLKEGLQSLKALQDNDQKHAANTSLIESARGTLKASEDPADTRNASSVRENILFTQNPFNGLPSVAESVMDFNKANLSGDRDAAYVALANMRDFATALRNKTEALDKSSYIKTKEGEAPKNKVAFTNRSNKGPFEDTKGVYANTDVASSVINAYEVRYDAVAVSNAYNVMRQNPAFVNDPEFNEDIEVAAFTKNLDDAGYRNNLTNIGKIDPNAPGVVGAEAKAKEDAAAKAKTEAEAKATEEAKKAAEVEAAAVAKAKADAEAEAAAAAEVVVEAGNVKTQKMITVEDARANPDIIFVFGDNLIGKGKRGQAVIRDEPNAMGIPTKRLPSMNDNAFFGQDIAEEKAAITTAINKIMAARESGKNVIFPEDGVGTGLANLQEKSPEVHAHLQSELVRAGLISAPVVDEVVVEGKGSEPWFNAIKDILVQTGKGVNYFLRGFKPKKSGLSLAQFTDPVDHFLKGVGQLKAEENGLTRELSEKEHAAASTLLVDVYPKFKQRFDQTVEAVLNKRYTSKKYTYLSGKTYETILGEETTDPTLYDAKQLLLMSKETLPLNLLENQGDKAGKLVMNEGAIQAVFMATMEWLAKDAARGKPFMKNEDISKIFYEGSKDGYVTDQMRTAVQGGTVTSQALDEISRSTMNLLGVSPNDDVTADLTQGLFKALASNAMDIMTSRDQNGELVQDKNKILDMRFTDVIIEPKSDEDIVEYKKKHPLSRDKTEYSEAELSITKKYLTVQLNKDHPLAQEDGVFANLKSMTDVFSQTFTSTAEKVRYVGAPSKDVAETQQRSKTDLSGRVQGVIKNLQNTESFVNMPMFSFVGAFGKTNYRDLMGYIDTSTGKFGSVHKVSIEGKNKSITSAIDGTYAYIEDAVQMAEVEGKKFEDIPHFFKWAMTKVGRLMQVGLVTQQGDKFMREMIASTNSTLDMTDPIHEKFLWLAIAQSIGVNPAKTSHEEAIAKTKKILEDKKGLGPAARLLTRWVEHGSKPMTEKQTASLKKYLGDYSKRSGQPVTDKMIHALVTHAQLDNAISLAPDGIPREFKTALALESDGVTDGIINALMHMTTGEFTKEFFELVAKGGVLFSKDPTAKVTLNEFIDLHEKGEYADIYMMVSKHFAKSMQEDLDTSTVDEKAYKEALYRLVQAFVPAFDANGGIFNIGRDFVKNPSTVLIYGSSAGGIAGKINGELMSGFHSMLNDIAQGKKDRDSADVVSIMKDIQLVAGFETKDGKGVKTSERKAMDDALATPTAPNATLSRATVESLRVAIEKNIAETLTDSIDVITGGLQAEMKFTQRISNLQAELFKYSFEKAIEAKKKAKTAAYKAGTATPDLRDDENLTENEVQQIFQETMKVAPIYQGADTNFEISTGEKIDSGNEVSRSFSGRIPGNVSRPTAKEAGVKVSPYMTIGVGDGGMIIEIYGDGSVEVKNTLPIYDGVEQGLENVIESSRRINKGAYDGWMNGDIHGPIHQSFAQTLSFFSEADYEALPKPTQASIQKALGYYTNDGKTKRTKTLGSDPWNGYASILEELYLAETKAMSAKARKAVMKRMGMHADHMSVAEAPYVTPGEGIASGNVRDYAAIAELANRLYEEEMAKLRGTQDKTRAQPSIQAPTPTMMNLVQALGKPVEGFPNVTVVTGAQLLPRLINDIGANKNQITMLRDILTKDSNQKGMPYADSPLYKTNFYFGNSTDLEAVRTKYHRELGKVKPIQAGVMYPLANVAFISNLAPETLLHEMLHKQVDEILQLLEQGSKDVPAHAVAAYGRLKAMVAHVRRMKTSAMPENQQASMKILIGVLNKNEGDSYTQVSELISWGLTNQNIVEQFKNQRVDNPFIKIVNKVLEYVSRMLGIKMHGKDLYANLKFNTEVLIAPETEKQKENKTKAQEKGLSNEDSPTFLEVVEDTNTSEDTDVIDMQDVTWSVNKQQGFDQVFGEDYSLEAVENRFQKKLESEIQKYANATTTADITVQAKLFDSLKNATDAVNYFGSQGMVLNAREHLAFRSVHSVMTGVFKMDAGAMSRAYKMYRHFINTVTEEDFHTANGADLSNLTTADKKLAKTQYDALTGKDGIRKQAGGQAELLAGFMALAQVHPGMRSIVEDMVPPKDTEFKSETFDDMVNSASDAAISLITRYTTSQDKPKGNVAQELAVIAGALTEVNKESEMLALMVKHNPTERANNAVSGFIDRASSAAYKKLDQAGKDAEARGASNLIKGPLLAATLVTALGSKVASKDMGKTLTSMMNKMEGYSTLRSLMTDILGQTDDNKALYKLLNQAKAVIDKIRQNFRDDVPANLESYFKVKPTKQQWAHMTQGIAKTGIMDLGRSEGLAMLKNMSQLTTETQKQEGAVRALAGNLTPRYMDKAKMLAHHMMIQENKSGNLLTNTYAITHLLNEGVNISARAKANSSVDLFEAIDKLVSLYAVALMDPDAKVTLEYMAINEPEGLEKVAGYHENMTRLEKEKLGANNITDPQDVGRLYNGRKGFIPATPSRGASVRIADDLDDTIMIRKGYTKGAKYHGDPSENYQGTRSEYYSSHAGRNNYRQGAAQTVRASYMGTDMKTGLAMDGTMGGAILGKTVGASKRRIYNKYANRSMDNLPVGDHLIPRFDTDGNVSAYERPLAPALIAKLNKDENMGRMLGVWAGRIFEEAHAREINEKLFQLIKANYDKDYAQNPDEYTNVADPKHPDAVIRDAWKTLGYEGKILAEKHFGAKDEMWIRKDMVDNALGYRKAGVTDAWTGVTRWSPETQENMKNAAIVLMGNDAYTYLVKGETALQDAVSYAKDTLIVRGIVVMVDNFTSNKLQLMTWNISPLAILNGTRTKALETIEYRKNIKRINALNTDIDASIDSLSDREIDQKKAEISALEAANANMSIAVLIEAGEFSTIAEGLDEADQDNRESNIAKYLEKAVNKLPSKGKTILKNVIISKDTAIYKGLNHMVQYGDFIDKAILYDHLTQKRGMTKDEALDIIRDEFVAYNLVPGRVRDFFETNGMLWFYNYKLRIMKVALRTMRDRPVSALFFGGIVGPELGIDSVSSGALATQALNGDLIMSVGPGMGINSLTMNPIEGVITSAF